MAEAGVRSGAGTEGDPDTQSDAGSNTYTLDLKTKIFYGQGALGPMMTFNVVNLYLLAFYAPPDKAAIIAPSLAGLVIAIGEIVDGLLNPIIGAWSDRITTRWGRRRPFILFGALPYGVFFALLWMPAVNASPTVLFITFIAVVLAFYITDAITYNPYSALLPELTEPGTNQRVELNTWKNLFIVISVALGLLAPIVVGQYLGYTVMGVLFGTITSVSLFLLFFGIRERPQQRATAESFGLKDALKYTLKNKLFLVYFIVLIIIMFGFRVILSSVMYIMEGIVGLRATPYQLIAMGLVFVMTLISLPIVFVVATKLGRVRTLRIVLVLWVIILPCVSIVGLIPDQEATGTALAPEPVSAAVIEREDIFLDQPTLVHIANASAPYTYDLAPVLAAPGGVTLSLDDAERERATTAVTINGTAATFEPPVAVPGPAATTGSYNLSVTADGSAHLLPFIVLWRSSPAQPLPPVLFDAPTLTLTAKQPTEIDLSALIIDLDTDAAALQITSTKGEFAVAGGNGTGTSVGANRSIQLSVTYDLGDPDEEQTITITVNDGVAVRELVLTIVVEYAPIHWARFITGLVVLGSIGFPLAGTFLLPDTILSDIIDADEVKTGLRREGVYFGMNGLGIRIANSLGIGFLGVFLDVYGRGSGSFGLLAIAPIAAVCLFFAVIVSTKLRIDEHMTRGVIDQKREEESEH